MTDTCAICGEPTTVVGGTPTHAHGGPSCGTGDGSTASPKTLWDVREADLRAREQRA